jgi:hypothetical protein
LRIFREFLGFLGTLVEFSDLSGIVEKIAEFGHPGSTGKIGISEDL